jgi:hypothetical protein
MVNQRVNRELLKTMKTDIYKLIKEENYVLVGDAELLSYYSTHFCDLTISTESFNSFGYGSFFFTSLSVKFSQKLIQFSQGFALQKNSPYTDEISHMYLFECDSTPFRFLYYLSLSLIYLRIIKLEETGVIQALFEEQMNEMKSTCASQSFQEFNIGKIFQILFQIKMLIKIKKKQTNEQLKKS